MKNKYPIDYPDGWEQYKKEQREEHEDAPDWDTPDERLEHPCTPKEVNMEMFNKSRAQEARMMIDRLVGQVEEMDKKLNRLKTELRERCPHPDQYVRKLDSFHGNPMMAGGQRKKIVLYYCDLCHQSQGVKA